MATASQEAAARPLELILPLQLCPAQTYIIDGGCAVPAGDGRTSRACSCGPFCSSLCLHSPPVPLLGLIWCCGMPPTSHAHGNSQCLNCSSGCLSACQYLLRGMLGALKLLSTIPARQMLAPWPGALVGLVSVKVKCFVFAALGLKSPIKSITQASLLALWRTLWCQ